ncbi:hypothetical protein ABW21_db0209483 [Orbilia brochopaga]|nr:hypothetical protein ABW21_db0209483 [Drechslerella brochopaga]
MAVDSDSAVHIDAPLYSSQYSDFTLLVGEEATKFCVHRIILTVQSGFFKVVCANTNFKEGVEQLARLPEIDVETMTNILRWFYQAPLGIPEDLISDDGYEKFKSLLDAANYLDIESAIGLLSKAMNDYLLKGYRRPRDKKDILVCETRKVDLLCRIYTYGSKMEDGTLAQYITSLKFSRQLGVFMNTVKELDDCHATLFRDIMVALYSMVD